MTATAEVRKRLISQEFSKEHDITPDPIRKFSSEPDIIETVAAASAAPDKSFAQQLIQTDHDATRCLQVLRRLDTNSRSYMILVTLFTLCEILGSGVTLLPISLATVLQADDLPHFTFYTNIFLAQLYNCLVTVIVKAAVGRDRPGTQGPFPGINRFSFPSGHSTRMALLSYLVVRLSWEQGLPWWGYVFVGFAVCVSMSRVLLGRHYVTDVIGGHFLGCLNGAVFIALLWAGELGGMFQYKTRFLEMWHGLYEYILG